MAARIAEHHLVPRAREDRPELATHQSRTQNANSHAAYPPRFAAQRSTIRCELSEYRAPCTVIWDAAFSMSRRSPSVSSMEAPATFSFKRCSLVVPGIGTIQGF